jgi:hypothetical protein
MKRFILSIILLIVIIGVGQLLMNLAPAEQQPESQTQLPTPVEHLTSQPDTTTDTTADTITTNTITPTPIPSDTTTIVTTK